tara:strand:+ start:252 stop:1451 length:1200 start_codon:yes stop_codon:yes gene_type:complete
MNCLNMPFINLKTLAATSVLMATATMPLAFSSTAIAQDRDRQAEIDSGTFPTAQSMQEGVAAEIKDGKLTKEQGDMILRVHERLLKGVKSGRINSDEAMNIMEERVIAIYEGEGRKGEGRKGEGRKGEGRKAKVDGKARYDEAVANMTEMVKNGEITREQMEQRLNRMKKSMDQERTITKKEYDEAVARMKTMVEAGEITREQMQQRLDRMKKMMTKERTFTREEIAKARAEMQKMVEAGEITREQMQQRLARMQKQIAKDKIITREDIAKAQADMKKMVEAGKITEEQMRQRLGEMRRMMKSQNNPRDGRAEYKRMEGRLKQAVESGRMTQEEANQKLKEFGSELRRRMSRENPRSGNEMSDECRELGAQLRQSVADGEMTAEEARAAFELECGKNDR